MRCHPDTPDTQLATLDAQLEQIAGNDRWRVTVTRLRAFRGIGTLTALGLLAELRDLTQRELNLLGQRERDDTPAAVRGQGGPARPRR